MSRLVLLTVLANAAGTAILEHKPTRDPMEKMMDDRDIEESHFANQGQKLTSFEMGCYYKKAPSLEKGGDDGRSYRGLVSYTESGKTCKNWLSDNKWTGAGETSTPDIEDDAGIMSWGNGIGNHNYCRNPNPKTSGFDRPWCFTQDPKKEKEACNIDPCPSGEKNKPDYYPSMAKDLMNTMREGMLTPPEDCLCADEVRHQLFGGDTPSMDTRLKFLQTNNELSKMMARKNMGTTRDGMPCYCRR